MGVLKQCVRLTVDTGVCVVEQKAPKLVHLDTYYNPALIRFITMVLVLLMECLMTVSTSEHSPLDFQMMQ